MDDPTRPASDDDGCNSLRELGDRFIAERLQRGEIVALTGRNQRAQLAVFARAADCAPSELDDEAVGRWLAHIATLAPATRRSSFSAVRLFCHWLVKRGVLNLNPILDVKPPRVPQPVARAMQHSDVAQLVASLPDARARAMVLVMVGLGLRCCEVSNLQVGDWDRGRDTLIVRGKFGHERVLPLTDEARGALAEYMAELPASSGPMFRSKRKHRAGLRPDSISGVVSEWMRAAEVKRAAYDGVAAHALRHTAATDVLDASNDLRSVQQMLGHTHLATTSIYLRGAGLGQLRAAMGGRRYGPEITP